LTAVDPIFQPDLSGFRRIESRSSSFESPVKRGSNDVAAPDPRRKRLGYGKQFSDRYGTGFFTLSARSNEYRNSVAAPLPSKERCK